MLTQEKSQQKNYKVAKEKVYRKYKLGSDCFTHHLREQTTRRKQELQFKTEPSAEKKR